jgi:hypothetical protein
LATTQSVAAATTAKVLIAANDRRALTIFNSSTAFLYILIGNGTASPSFYTNRLASNQFWDVPPVYCGLRVSGVWSAANGQALLTSVTE